MIRKVFGIWIAWAAATLAAPALLAQTTSATLVGVVRTQQGVPIPDARVQARSDSTGILRSAVTDPTEGMAGHAAVPTSASRNAS